MTSRIGNAEAIEQKFGFKEIGTFRCAYGNEKPLLVCLAIVTVMLCGGVLIFSTWVIAGEESMLFWMLVFTFSEAAVLFVCATLAKLILYGKECFYHADEQKMSIERAGKFEDFFYMNVVAVNYRPLVTLGKQRGFTVTITTRKGTAVYKFIFARTDVVMEPSKTPFAIIEQRAGINNEPQFRQSAQPVETETSPEALPFSRSAQTLPTFAALTPEQELTAKGSFRVPHKHELLIFTLCCAVGVAAMVDGMCDLASGAPHPELIIICIVLLVLLDIGFYRMMHRTEYKYAADSKEFRITDKKGEQTVIYFCDVERIEYKPYRLLWKQRGYTVNIVMKYKTLTYKYLFLANKKWEETTDMPFYHIERMVSGEYQNTSKLGRQ